MEALVRKREVREQLAFLRAEGAKTIALVPTMGALHDGHLSLVRAAQAASDAVAVSVFVNPTQFGPGEDFDSYPRDLAGDLALLDAEGVDVAFAPSTDEMYGDGPLVTVDPGKLGRVFEGASRPGHFAGVCTVVAKLFNIIEPDLAFFGEKDYQQLQIVRRMVRDLDFSVCIEGVPIGRDADGLALSSRNVRLSAEDRQRALALWRALGVAREAAQAGETDARWLAAAMDSAMAGTEGVGVDYAEVVAPDTLEPLQLLDRPARAIVAARVGGVRLIDNAPLGPRGAQS